MNQAFPLPANTMDQLFPQYAPFEELISGGQKFLYRLSLGGEPHVMKVILANPDAAKETRTLRELAVAKQLTGPWFLTPVDSGIFQSGATSYHFVIEPFIKGGDLRRPMVEKTISPKDKLRICVQVLCALEQLEKRQLVHRDLKPENILLDGERVYVIDFGILRDLTQQSLTPDQQRMGPMTPGYSAPEQTLNRKQFISNRTDLFSFGVLAYELFAGRHPFMMGARSKFEVIDNSLKLDPPPLKERGADEQISDIVARCLEKNPKMRPKTALNVRVIFQWVMNGKGVDSAESGNPPVDLSPSQLT